ncbi:hypothetical protein KCV03_g10037, partial [Aureobasidium melanogenum]
SPLSNLQQEVLGNSPTSRSATPSLDHPTSPSLEEGTSYGSPNESTIGLLEDLASNLASGQSSPAQSEIYVQGTPQDFGSTYSPTPSSPGSPIPLSYSLGTQGPTRPIYGDEHTPPPPDVAGIPTGLGQDKYNTYQPRNKYLQQLFSYNHVQAKDHTFRGSQATSFIAAAARCASRYTRQPTEKHLLDFLLLPKAGLTLGIQSEEFSTQYVLQHYPDLMLPPPNQVEADRAQEFLGQPDNRQDNPCSRAQRLVEKGYLGRAARALVDPSALARNSAEILAKLREKHPVGQPHPFTSSASPRPGPRPVPEDVLQALASFAPDTAPGLSGWPPPIILAYLDDIYIISGQEITLRELEDYLKDAPITLNTDKTKTQSLAAARTTGIKTLGSFIGSTLQKASFLASKIQDLQVVLDRLKALPKQHALLLLRASTSTLLRHLPRTISAQGLFAEFRDIDIRLLETVKYLQGSGDSRALDQDLVALPTRLGGLGIPLYAETAQLAFQNSQAIADITLQRILPPKLFWRLPRAPSPTPSETRKDELEGNIDEDTEEDTLDQDQDQNQDYTQKQHHTQDQHNAQEQALDRGRSRSRANQQPQPSLPFLLSQDPQQQPLFPPEHRQIDPTSTGPARTIYRAAIDKLNRARLVRVQQKLSLQQENVRLENSAFLGRRWLLAMPTSQPLRLSDMDIAAALSIRLLTSPEDSQDICRHCDRAYTFAHEDACRARTRQTIVKHNKICQALTTALQTIPENKVTLEPQGDYRGIRTDIRIDNPKGTTYLDVSVISLGKETARKDPNNTLSATEKAKKLKYQNLGRAFRPFILSQGGLLGKETSQTYKEFQKSLTPSTSEWLDKYISTTLVRLRARNWLGYGID